MVFENGEFKEIKIVNVKGKRPLDKKELKRFEKLVETFKNEIVKKWVDFFVYNKEIKPEKITKKIE
ncbi:MAG: hypothetical protein ABII90_14290 [Bacteroidota bacterium]